VAPPLKRSEPIPPATPPKSTSLNLSAKAPAKTKPVPTPTSTPSPATRPPTTGPEKRTGTSAAETGATSQTTGLTFGGKTAGDTAVNLDTTFCCPEYIEEMRRRIVANWRKDQPVTGSVTVVFEIQKDGSFTPPQIERSGGDITIDVASLDAFKQLRLPPLPKEYTSERLKIHLTFPYVR
jgi:outer membrane biosynthesis protein TonB